MTLNPKKDFQDDAALRKWWASVVEQRGFNTAINAAFITLQQGLQPPPDLATAASYAYRIEGAKQFAQILMNLSEGPKEIPMVERRDNLKHQ